jgi:hypothetical protein
MIHLHAACRPWTHFAFALTAVILLAAPQSPIRADIITLQADNSLDNSFTFTVVPLAAVSDVVNISGTIVVDVTKSGTDITSITFLSADLAIDDVSISQDVNFFGSIPGTLGVSFTNTKFSIAGGPFSVSAGAFDPTGLGFTFFQGTLGIDINSDVTGAINTTVDYATNPSTVTFGFSSREGSVSCDNNILNLVLPMDVASQPTPIQGFNIFLAINATLNGTAVPEASTLMLTAGTLFTLGLIGYRRRAQ